MQFADPSFDLSCDVAVLGAGTAGLAAERAARSSGAKTLLIDDRFAGTTCATVGCMPSKLLVDAGARARAIRTAADLGLEATINVDGSSVMRRVRQARDHFVETTKASFAALPVGVAVQGRARFTSPNSIGLEDGRTVKAGAFVIATGSRPATPSAFRNLGGVVDTNETIFELTELPASLAVIGAGALGLELAQAFAGLGVEVAVFERGSRLGGVDDEQVHDEFVRILRQTLDLHLGVAPSPSVEAGGVVLEWSGRRRQFERVLLAAGRPPQLSDLDLKTAGLELDASGVPHFDPQTLQCADAPIFIAGDAAADRPVLHEAAEEGTLAGRNAALFPRIERTERKPPLLITFTDPPIATVGAPASAESVVGRASFADQGRAKVMGRPQGAVVLHASRPEGRLTGAVLLGPAMDHVAHFLALAVQRGETATSLLEAPFYHPTLEEGLKPALREICHLVHAPVPVGARATPPGA